MHRSRYLSRRQFVQSSAAAASALTAAPYLIAQDKDSTSPNPVIGVDGHRYECHHDWGTLPDAVTYGKHTHGIAVDSNGLVYVTHHGNPGSVMVFDDKGKFIRSMAECHYQGGEGRGHGIDVRKEEEGEFLYLSSDINPRSGVLGWTKMTLTGHVVWTIGAVPQSGKYDINKPRCRPMNISFAPEGGFFLGDGYGSNLIHQYDKQANYQRTISGDDHDGGRFKTPHGHWLDQRDGTPKLVICDRANKRLQWYDMEGKHLKTLDGFLFPADIDIRGDVMLVPDLHARITLLDNEDKVIVHLGGHGEFDAWKGQALNGMRARRNEWQPGRFVHPHDACFDNDGNIFVAEWVVGGRITKLRKVD